MKSRPAFCLLVCFLMLLAISATAPCQVTVTLTPLDPPIQIPASGGSFDFNIAVTNSGSSSVNVDVWCMVTLPDGSIYGPVQGPANLTLAPGANVNRARTQQVPAEWPPGIYTYLAHAGVYADTVWAKDSFQFEKYGSADGTELWVERWNGPGMEWDYTTAIATDSLDNVYVAGYAWGWNSYDYATVKYDACGNELWAACYNGTGNGNDKVVAMAVDDNGNVYVTGESEGTANYDFMTIKYDTAGRPLWFAPYSGPENGYDAATSIATDRSGNSYVTGFSYGIGSAIYPIIKYDAFGTPVWVVRSIGSSASAPSVALDGDGNIYIAGSCYGIGDYPDYATFKYDTSGNQIWVAFYNGPENSADISMSLAVDGSGNVCVTGRSYGSGTGWDWATVKYDDIGQELWSARLSGVGDDQDVPYDVELDESGNALITGVCSFSGTNSDYTTIKYDAFGNQIWLARYNGPGNSYDCAKSLALNGDGDVYITGTSCSDETYPEDYATVKYDASGNQIWVARYNGPANFLDLATCLALDNRGDVYVTGYSNTVRTNWDYLTIKYSGGNSEELLGNLDGWDPVTATVLGGEKQVQDFRLHPCYPNPFNATTTIRFELPVAGYVKLEVFDVNGRNVGAHSSAPSSGLATIPATGLIDGWREAGVHEFTFDGSHLPSGVYICRLQAGGFTASQKIILLK